MPIVRNTGGLADAVQLYDPEHGTGTGIVFNDYSSEAVGWALNTALDLYQKKAIWTRLMRNGMAQDFSWSGAAKRYVALYQAVALDSIPR